MRQEPLPCKVIPQNFTLKIGKIRLATLEIWYFSFPAHRYVETWEP